MAKEKNILQEAIADANKLREAACANAKSVLMEHMKENVQSFVEQELNDALQNEGEVNESEIQEGEIQEGELKEMAGEERDLEDELDLPDEEELEDESEEEGEPEEVEEGLTEADLEEALKVALSEVTHGDLGEMELIIQGPDAHSTGIEDQDKKEAGWEEKTAPAAKPAQIHTGEQYHQEALRWKAKVIQLVKENKMLKKAFGNLSKTLKEVQLFNTKLFYASKLMQREGLSNSAKQQIVKRMDKVGSLSEARNLYESLDLALGLMSEKAAPKKSVPSLTEALGSDKSAGAGRGVSGLNEGMKQRFRELAGLIEE